MAMRDATTTEGSGRQDPGQIVLLADDTCANVGQVSQTIRMPRLSRAEPLVVRATYAAGIGSSGFRPLIGIGSGWEDSPQLGYEILPNKYFYRYQPPTPAKDLLVEFWKLEKEAEQLLRNLGTNGGANG